VWKLTLSLAMAALRFENRRGGQRSIGSR